VASFSVLFYVQLGHVQSLDDQLRDVMQELEGERRQAEAR